MSQFSPPSHLPSQQNLNVAPSHYPDPAVSFPGRTLDDFLTWLPFLALGETETMTTFYWHQILQFFTLGARFYNGAAVDLDQKDKDTERKPTFQFRNGPKAPRGERFVTINHNRPDWVLVYNEFVALIETLVPRVCMTFEAKRVTALGTVSSGLTLAITRESR